MPSLRELQITFAHALLHPGHVDAGALLRTGTLAPEESIACHRNNVRSNHRETLKAVYPVVARLVGGDCFRAASAAYARAYPSDSGDLNRFGRHFPEFLASFEPVRALPYLGDVAWLEWLIEECFYGAEHPPLRPEALASMPPADLGNLRFRLHPSARLFASRFPLLAIWASNQPGAPEDLVVDLDAGEAFLLVRRDGFAAVPEPIDHGSFCLLSLLSAGRSLAEAFEYVISVDRAFDLGAFLARHVADGVLVAVEAPVANGGPRVTPHRLAEVTAV